jgi:intracellular septation protein
MKFLFDFFPIILFYIAYKSYDIFVATGVAIAATFIQVAIFWYRHRRFERMHLITLALIVVLGGATLYFQDADFIKWKVSVVNWLFGLAFLASQFIGKKPLTERMMGAAVALPDVIWTRLNMSWVSFFTAVGFINLYVFKNFEESTWVDFKLYGVLGLTLLFVILQGFYLSRHVIEDEAEASEES